MNKEISSIWLWSLFFIVFGGAAILVISAPDSSDTDPVTADQQNDIKFVKQKDDLPVSEQENEAQKVEKEEAVPQTEMVAEDDSAQSLDNQSNSPASNETVSQRNAVRSAKFYLNYTAFSRDGLVEQLEYEQYSHADAVYGADNSGAGWYEQAAKSAEQYMEYSAFSRGGLIDQLKYEGYTQTQAEHGADTVGL